MLVEYSIVSIGTENSGSNGYMCVTEKAKYGQRYICPLPHFTTHIDKIENFDSLVIDGELAVEKVALIRFQMISYLALKKVDVFNFNNICVVGGGALGVGTYFELKRLNLKNISLYTRRSFFEKLLLEKNFSISNKNFINYDCIFECTGNKELIDRIIYDARPNTSIVLLGTPRGKVFIDLLVVHRKNLKIFGAHELNGVEKKDRQNAINCLSMWYSKNEFDCERLIKIHRGSQKELNKVLNHEFIEPINVMMNDYKGEDF